MGVLLCREVLPGYVKAYPRLKTSLTLSYEYSDLLAEQIDVALRIGHPTDSSLMAIKVGESPRGLYASPRYLKSKGTPKHPRELSHHSLLAFRTSVREELSWTLHRGSETAEIPVDGSLSVENFQALSEAAIAGMGITLLPELFFQKAIRKGDLVKVLPAWKFPTGDITAVYPSRELKPAKLEAFLAFLKNGSLFPPQRI